MLFLVNQFSTRTPFNSIQPIDRTLSGATTPGQSEPGSNDWAICCANWPQSKVKENEKRDKYLDLARELKNCGTWKWRWYQLYFGALGTVTKGLVQELEDV